MMSWQDGRPNWRPWQDAPVDLAGSDYSGPADGDFARYVDALMAQAEARVQAQRSAHAPAPAALAPAPSGRAASRGTARKRAEVADIVVQKISRSKAVGKLIPFGIWLLFVLTIAFWEDGVFWLIGLLVVGAILFNAVRTKKA